MHPRRAAFLLQADAQGDFTILACLKENRPKLSPTCRDVLVSHGQLRTFDQWKIGHVLIRMQKSPSPNGTACRSS
jgi:hypothetical protein